MAAIVRSRTQLVQETRLTYPRFATQHDDPRLAILQPLQ
jgi:hypothetical protein